MVRMKGTTEEIDAGPRYVIERAGPQWCVRDTARHVVVAREAHEVDAEVACLLANARTAGAAMWEVWAWYAPPADVDPLARASSWYLESLCFTRHGAADIAAALLACTRATPSLGITAAEVWAWAPEPGAGHGQFARYERFSIAGDPIRGWDDGLPPGMPGPAAGTPLRDEVAARRAMARLAPSTAQQARPRRPAPQTRGAVRRVASHRGSGPLSRRLDHR